MDFVMKGLLYFLGSLMVDYMHLSSYFVKARDEKEKF